MFNFFRKRKARKEAAKQVEIAEAVEASKEEKPKPAPVKKEEPKAAPVKKEEPKPAPAKKEEPKPAPAKKAPAKKAPAKKAPAKKEEPKAANYHVSQNKDKKSARFKEWRVRKEGSQKTIKYFQTQAEAIDFAKGLADNQDASIVIHKVDGSIRKQDYSEK